MMMRGGLEVWKRAEFLGVCVTERTDVVWCAELLCCVVLCGVM